MAGEPKTLPLNDAPRDGTMVRLLVKFSQHSLEDSVEPQWTIGANSFDHTEDDVWQFAGWCWSHDHFTQGEGEPIGWLPFHATPAQTCGICGGYGYSRGGLCSCAIPAPSSTREG